MMLVTGCQGQRKTAQHFILKTGGKVVENITEDFNQDNYDEKDVKDIHRAAD